MVDRLRNAHAKTRAECAETLGITTVYVSQLESLLQAPDEVQQMVAAGTVSASLAISTTKSAGANATAVLKQAAEAAKQAGKAKVTPKLVKAAATPKKAAPTHDARDMIKLIADLSRALRKAGPVKPGSSLARLLERADTTTLTSRGQD